MGFIWVTLRLSQLRVHLVPRSVDICLTAYNSMERASEFWLNHFWDKDAFFSLSIICMLRRQTMESRTWS